MHRKIAPVLLVMLFSAVTMSGCNPSRHPSAEHVVERPSTPVPQTPQEALVGTWINEAGDHRTIITFFADGTVQRTHESSTMLGNQVVTGQQDFAGVYQWTDAVNLSLHLTGTITNSVEGTRQMDVIEHYSVVVEPNRLSLNHHESNQADVFTRTTPS